MDPAPKTDRTSLAVFFLRSAAALLSGIVVFVGLSLLAAQCLVPSAVQTIQPASISHAAGNAYQVPPMQLAPVRLGRFFEIRADSAAYPTRSTLVITENGIALPHPYSAHADVVATGKGRYSYWDTPAGGVLIFSASDNSDPTSNGRQYVVSARPVLLPTYFSIVLLCPLAMLFLRRVRYLTLATISALSVAALAVWGSIFFEHVIIAPDSTTYITWSNIVPLGYPIFLSSVKTAFGTLGWTGLVQVALMIFACAMLAWSVRGLEIVAFFLLLCCISSLWYAGWILSEGLFVPLVLINLAAAFFVISSPQRRYAILFSATAALAMFVRPQGYYLPVGVAFLLIAMQGRTLWVAKWAVLPFLICIAGTIAVNSAVRGSVAQSHIGRILFTNVALLFDRTLVDGKYQTYARVVDDALKPQRAEYLKATSLDLRVTYLLGTYNPRLTSMDEALSKVKGDDKVDFAQIEKIYLNFFITTVTKRPLAYATLLIEQAFYAWRGQIVADYGPFRVEYYRLVNDLQQMLDQVEKFKLPVRPDAVGLRGSPLNSYQQTFFDVFERSYQLIRDQRWLVYLVGIITLLAIPVAAFIRRGSAYWLSLAYCGVMIHGSIFLTCATTAYMHRYAASVDPIILVAGAIMIGGAVPHLRPLGRAQRLFAPAKS